MNSGPLSHLHSSTLLAISLNISWKLTVLLPISSPLGSCNYASASTQPSNGHLSSDCRCSFQICISNSHLHQPSQCSPLPSANSTPLPCSTHQPYPPTGHPLRTLSPTLLDAASKARQARRCATSRCVALRCSGVPSFHGEVDASFEAVNLHADPMDTHGSRSVLVACRRKTHHHRLGNQCDVPDPNDRRASARPLARRRPVITPAADNTSRPSRQTASPFGH